MPELARVDSLIVLDDLPKGRFEIGQLLDLAGDGCPPEQLRRAKSPLPGDELEALALRPNEDRLQQARLMHGRGQLAQRILVDGLPDLERRGVDASMGIA